MTTTPAVPPALLAFSLGPVQDFIATARRTQDLWMGSYILSFLTQAALRAVVGDVQDSAARERIIYPDISGEGKAQHPILRAFWMDEKAPQGVALATLPNKFVAWAEDSGAAAQLGRSAEAAVYAAWETLSQSVARHFPGRLAASNWQGLSWGANPREWFEVYWAVETPLAGDDYARLSGRAEAALQARKRLRNFLPVEAEGEKCTLCGVRPSLAPRPNLPRSVLKEAWRQLALDLHKYSDRNDPEYDSNYGGLTAALTAATGHRLSMVTDRGGSGTTALAVTGGSTLAARFGPESAARHRESGAVCLDRLLDADALAGLRCDVDTLADLRVATDLGLGKNTADAGLGSPP